MHFTPALCLLSLSAFITAFPLDHSSEILPRDPYPQDLPPAETQSLDPTPTAGHGQRLRVRAPSPRHKPKHKKKKGKSQAKLNTPAAARSGQGGNSQNGASGQGDGMRTMPGAGGASKTEDAPPSQGSQFIGGPCEFDSDCALNCCGFTSGLCAGSVIALTRDGGCGHGEAQPNANAAQQQGFTAQAANFVASQAAKAGPTPPPAAGGNNSKQRNGGGGSAQTPRPKGSQFITGPCASDHECGSGCCGFNTGKCAGPVVALEGTLNGGCGFGNAKPNANAARNSGSTTQADAFDRAHGINTGAGNGGAGGGGVAVSRPKGSQFITGPCSSDDECGSGCCGFKTGKCAGPVVALEGTLNGGCGFGDAKPNANAARRSGSTTQADAFDRAQGIGTGGAGGRNGGQEGNTPPQPLFDTAPCKSDSECRSGCCAMLTGTCSEVIPANESRGGCGFGKNQAPLRPGMNSNMNKNGNQQASAGGGNRPSNQFGTVSGKPLGFQEVTGNCGGDAECIFGCCRFDTHVCAVPNVAFAANGCGFGEDQPRFA